MAAMSFRSRAPCPSIDGGRHVAPLFAGDTVFAWSQVLDRAEIPGRDDVGAVRLRLVATKNRPCVDFPLKAEKDYDPCVILDFDYWALIPR
jgi:2-methylfumaryl-CoA hydratase